MFFCVVAMMAGMLLPCRSSNQPKGTPSDQVAPVLGCLFVIHSAMAGVYEARPAGILCHRVLLRREMITLFALRSTNLCTRSCRSCRSGNRKGVLVI